MLNTLLKFDRQIDAEYKALTQLCLDALAQPNAPVTHLTSVMWAARSLERIGDHAKNISEYIIFQVAGEDVRHHRATEPVKP